MRRPFFVLIFLMAFPTSLLAAILNFENQYDLGVNLGGEMKWNGTGGGHLYMEGHSLPDYIYFNEPTHVISFQMNHLPFNGGGIGWGGDTVTISAFDSSSTPLWQGSVELNVYDWSTGWVTVNLDIANVSTLKFSTQYRMWPSIDNMVLGTTNPVPIPGAIWLLASGLFGIVAAKHLSKSGVGR